MAEQMTVECPHCDGRFETHTMGDRCRCKSCGETFDRFPHEVTAPETIREQYKYAPVYCTACELPVSVTIADDPQPYRWECTCSVGYPTASLPDQWVVPDPKKRNE